MNNRVTRSRAKIEEDFEFGKQKVRFNPMHEVSRGNVLAAESTSRTENSLNDTLTHFDNSLPSSTLLEETTIKITKDETSLPMPHNDYKPGTSGLDAPSTNFTLAAIRSKTLLK